MMSGLSHKERIFLLLFIVFVTIFELYHVAIDTNPPMVLRAVYAAIYLVFAVLSPALIPVYTAINLIVERFSCSFGEFLPNTLLFHIFVLVFGILCLRNKQNVRGKAYDYRSFKWFVLLYVYAIVALLLHVNIPSDFSFLINGAFMLVFLHFLSISKDKYIQALLRYSVIVMFIVCIIGLFNYESLVGDYSTSLGDVDRLDWKDANYFSFFIGMMMLFTLYSIKMTKSKNQRRLYMLGVLLMMVTMAALISRGAIVALAITLIYYYRKEFFSLRSLGYLLLVAVAVAGLYYIGILDGLIMRFMSDDLQTGSGRTELWMEGIKTFFNKDSSVIAFGAGEGQALKMTYLNGQYWSPHNNYLSMLYNYGIVGLTIFLIWIGSMFLYFRTRESRAAILFVAVNCMTIVPFTYVSPVWFVIPLIMIWDKRISGKMLQ